VRAGWLISAHGAKSLERHERKSTAAATTVQFVCAKKDQLLCAPCRLFPRIAELLQPSLSLSHTHIHSASFYTLAAAHGASERSSGCYGRVIYFFIHTHKRNGWKDPPLSVWRPALRLFNGLALSYSAVVALFYFFTWRKTNVKICDEIPGALARAKPTARSSHKHTRLPLSLTNREKPE